MTATSIFKLKKLSFTLARPDGLWGLSSPPGIEPKPPELAAQSFERLLVRAMNDA